MKPDGPDRLIITDDGIELPKKTGLTRSARPDQVKSPVGPVPGQARLGPRPGHGALPGPSLRPLPGPVPGLGRAGQSPATGLSPGLEKPGLSPG
ncbi:hypothetical protein KSP39_PZI004752 [Platanthera zijinensis]|uniref:Uncharacterized protein n=1 Tax=Platanthera zijinensis TaxID=2320716 RepID=A0AAP0BXK7_9ASPA